MRILIPDYGLGGSGISTYRRALVKNLLRNRVDVILVGEKRAYEIDNLDCEFYEQPKTISLYLPPFSRISYCKKLQKLIENIKFDLLHSPSPSTVSYLNLKKPTIVTAWFYPPSILGGIKEQFKYTRWFMSIPAYYYRVSLSYEDFLAYRKSSSIICVTEKLDEEMNRLGYPSVYIPPGIETANRIRKPKKYDKITLVFVAYYPMHKRKGLKFLISALNLAMKKNLIEKDFQLIVIGNRDAQLLRLSKIYKFIKLLGILDRNKTLEVMAKSHIFVAPSIYEEFGYVVLEGMACGLPVIASDIHSFRDLVRNGENGYLVDIRNTFMFAEKIAMLVNDEAKTEKFGEESIEIVNKEFCWSTLVPKIKEVYQTCLGKKVNP